MRYAAKIVQIWMLVQKNAYWLQQLIDIVNEVARPAFGNIYAKVVILYRVTAFLFVGVVDTLRKRKVRVYWVTGWRKSYKLYLR